MKFEKDYPVSANAFYDELMFLLKEDYERNTDHEIDQLDDLNGLSYETSFGSKNQNHAKVQVTKAEAGTCYESTIKSNRGTQVIAYQLSPLADGGMHVVYEERFEDLDFFTRWNYHLFMIFMKKSILRRMEAQLDFVNKKILEKGEG